MDLAVQADRECFTKTMNLTEPAPLILTLQLDATTFTRLDELRQRHFPPDRNFLSAHITLFHALPGDQLAAIRQVVEEVTSATTPFPTAFPALRMLGRGVAVEVVSPPLQAVRRQLASVWQPWLTAQDRQKYQPHVTIQNKVNATEARQLFAELSATWAPLTGSGEGLLLWRYLGGPWQAEGEFLFRQ